MGYYILPGQQSVTGTAARTVAQLTGGATPRRGKIFEAIVGALGAYPATNSSLAFDIVRLGGAGAGSTSTAFTPNPTDSAMAATSMVGAQGVTSEGSVIANSTLLYLPINMQNTVRFIVSQEAQYLTTPATASSGAACRVISSTFTSSVAAQLSYMEE